jgi:hypothetical protein
MWTLNQASQVLRPLSAAIQPMRHQPDGVMLASEGLLIAAGQNQKRFLSARLASVA